MASTSKDNSVKCDDIPGTSAMIGKLRDEVECPICLQRLTKPRVLSCLHTFCERCLQKLGRHRFDDDSDDEYADVDDDYGIIRCAVCRDITDLPSGKVSELKLDFRVIKVCEILDDLESRKRKFADSSQHRCEVCADAGQGSTNVPAADYCQGCGKFFCDQCSKVHRRLPGTADHHVVAIEGLILGNAKLRKTQHESESYKTCQEHGGEPNKFFCRTCVRPVCTLCTSFGPCTCHPDAVSPLGDAMTEMSGVVEMFTDRLKHLLSRVDGILGSTDKAISNTEVTKNKSIEKLERRQAELIRLLTAKFQHAITERQSSFNGKINDLRDVTERARKMKTMSEKAIDLACDVMKDVPGEQKCSDLATSYGCLQSVLDTITPEQLASMEREVSTIEQAVSSMPDIKMKGVKLEWTPDEQLKVEPILLDGQARAQPNNAPAATTSRTGPGGVIGQGMPYSSLGPNLPILSLTSRPGVPTGSAMRPQNRRASGPPAPLSNFAFQPRPQMR